MENGQRGPNSIQVQSDKELVTIQAREQLVARMVVEMGSRKDLIARMCSSAPFLEQFHALIRLDFLKELKVAYENEAREQLLVVDRGAFDCKYSRLLCAPILHKTVFQMDPIFAEFVVQTKEKQKKSHEEGDFSALNLSPKLRNMIPDSDDMKELAFELCLEWILKLETSLDLINRALEYGMISVQTEKTRFVTKHEQNIPSTALVFKTSMNGLVNRTIDSVIEKLFAFTSEGICNKINKFIVSSILVAFFGATVVGIGGFAISLIDLPDINVNFLSGVIQPVIRNLKKFLRIGDDNICVHVLREAISSAEETNQELLLSIEEIARCEFYSRRQKQQIDHLQDLADQVLNCKKKSNVRIEQSDVDAYVAYEELHGENEGWIVLKDPADCLAVKEIEGGYGFLEIEIKPNHSINRINPNDDDFIDLDELEAQNNQRNPESTRSSDAPAKTAQSPSQSAQRHLSSANRQDEITGEHGYPNFAKKKGAGQVDRQVRLDEYSHPELEDSDHERIEGTVTESFRYSTIRGGSSVLLRPDLVQSVALKVTVETSPSLETSQAEPELTEQLMSPTDGLVGHRLVQDIVKLDIIPPDETDPEF